MLPYRILFEQDMVSAVQGNKTGPFDARCNQTALLERHATVFPAVKNEGWALNLITASAQSAQTVPTFELAIGLVTLFTYNFKVAFTIEPGVAPVGSKDKSNVKYADCVLDTFNVLWLPKLAVGAPESTNVSLVTDNVT